MNRYPLSRSFQDTIDEHWTEATGTPLRPRGAGLRIVCKRRPTCPNCHQEFAATSPTQIYCTKRECQAAKKAKWLERKKGRDEKRER